MAPSDLAPGDALSILRLPDDDLVGVMRAALEGKCLRQLASTCRRMSELARTRMPTTLRVTDSARACSLVGVQLGVGVGPPFSGCERLVLEARSVADCCWVPGVLAAASQLSSLRALDLTATGHPASKRDSNVLVEPSEGDAAVQAPSDQVLDCMLAGLIGSISGLQQDELWKLSLSTDMMGPLAAAALGGLKQLSSLRSLNLLPRCTGGTRQLDFTPLSGMTGLVELVVGEGPDGQAAECIAPTAPAAVDGPFCFPATLSRLWLMGPSTAPWMQHLPGCSQLQQLVMTDVETSVAAVLELAGPHTPGLRYLHLHNRAEAGILEPLPTDALGALTALQHMDIHDGLCVETAADWEALGRLKALTYLGGIWVCGEPPQTWQHTALVELEASLYQVSPQAAAKMLLGLPALQRVWIEALGLSPGAAEGAAAVKTGDVRPSSHLTAMDIHWWPEFPLIDMTPILAAAGSSLLRLKVCMRTDRPIAGASLLPDLSACTALSYLHLAGFKQADIGDLVGCVQPSARTLQVLELHGWGRISPAAAKVLQYALPCLERVSFVGCRALHEDDPSTPAEEQLQQVQQALRQGLTMDVAESSDGQS